MVSFRVISCPAPILFTISKVRIPAPRPSGVRPTRDLLVLFCPERDYEFSAGFVQGVVGFVVHGGVGGLGGTGCSFCIVLVCMHAYI